jgi:hypothetical protein
MDADKDNLRAGDGSDEQLRLNQSEFSQDASFCWRASGHGLLRELLG